MATITSAQSGNWSATTTWVGGVVPVAADTAVAATGHVVAIDVDVTVVAVSQAGTGKFVLPGGRTLTGNVTINAGTLTSGGTVEVTATAGQTSTITGTVSGASSTLSNQAGVVVTGTGTLVLNGAVTGTPGNATDSSATECAAVYTNVNSTIIVNGTVTGGGTRKYGVYIGSGGSTASVTVNNTVTGGAGSNAWGAYTAGASAFLTIVGNVNAAGFSYAATSTGATSTISITGTVTGTGNGIIGVYTTGTSSVLNVTGSVLGGNGIQSSTAIGCTGQFAVVNITGPVVGGGGSIAYGLEMSGANATANITGNVTGGLGGNSYGVYMRGASSFVSIVGDLTATAGASNAVRSEATSSGYGIGLAGSLYDASSGLTAVHSRFLRLSSNVNAISRYANNVNFPNGGFVTRVSPDNVTGMAAQSNVRYGTVYGYNSELTGTLRVPPANSVASGVPVDNTTGTAALRPSDIASLVGAQIAAAITSPGVA